MAQKSVLPCTCLLRFRAGAQRCIGATNSDGLIDLLRRGALRADAATADVVELGGRPALVGNRDGKRRISMLGRSAVGAKPVPLSPACIDTHRVGARRCRDSSAFLDTSASAAAKKRAKVRARLEASRAECAIVSAS